MKTYSEIQSYLRYKTLEDVKFNLNTTNTIEVTTLFMMRTVLVQ